MPDNEKIKNLEKKVSELEKLRDNCTLTNHIKVSLEKCIQSNDEFKKEIEKKFDEDKTKQNIDKKNWWECTFCPIFIILYILLAWFLLTNITDKVFEYKKMDNSTKENKVVADAK